jgi:hypothetical protein
MESFCGIHRAGDKPGTMRMKKPLPNLLQSVTAAGLALAATAASAQGSFEGHTPPNLWPAPRVFHLPLDPEETSLLTMDRVSGPADAGAEKHPSPNRAYWFSWRRAEPDTVVIEVFNERDHILRLRWDKAGGHGPRLSWINEKLLYAELCRGRLFGEFFVLDVEAETILIRQKAVYGQIHFPQWKAGCRRFPDLPACRPKSGGAQEEGRSG